MQIWIRPSLSAVAVDDASITGIDCSSIPANVEMVWWNSAQGTQSGGGPQGTPPSGEILYNDRIAIRETFTDPSPYIAIINQWLLAAARQVAGASLPHQPNLTVPATALTVAQAQMVKNTILDGLFALKRKAPITFNGKTYDGSDAEQAAIANAISAAAQQNIDAANTSASFGSGNIVSAVNTAFSGLVGTSGTTGSINKVLTDHNTSADAAVQGHVTSSNAALSNVASDIDVGDAFIVSSGPSSINAIAAAYNTDMLGTVFLPLQAAVGDFVPTVGNPAFGTVASTNATIRGTSAPHTTVGTVATPTIAPATSTIVGPVIPWNPSDGSPIQNLTFAQLSALLKSLTDRRATLQATHLSKRAAIAALTSVKDIAAYDITAGW
jgi:hypothetical protein